MSSAFNPAGSSVSTPCVRLYIYWRQKMAPPPRELCAKKCGLRTGYREMTAAETKVSKVKREHFCQKNKIYGAACRKSPGDDFFVLMPDFGSRLAPRVKLCCKSSPKKHPSTNPFSQLKKKNTGGKLIHISHRSI